MSRSKTGARLLRAPWSACLLLLGLVLGHAEAKVQIVTTLPNLASIASEVGGEWVEVEAIAAGYQDPHYVQARPSYARRLRDADLLIANGLELESGWLPLLIDSARNPAVRPGSAGFLDAASAVPRILEVPGGPVDRSLGDVHPQGNPHLDLDPRNGVAIAAAISRSLAKIDPGHASVYEANHAAYARRLGDRIVAWETRAAGLRGQAFVAFHKEWEYFGDWLGLRLVGYVEDRAGIPPTPRHLLDLVSTMERESVGTILLAPYNDRKAAEGVAAKAGAEIRVLATQVGATAQVPRYEDLFEEALNALVAAAPPSH
ncbi:MAG: zinc ABC transporter substrate-binding protein [Candidatus Eisenbacteria bacterium]|nr:zinc ABC transporter substrate-binding protein [Candidatus Eisenbacteria bacterium]